MDWQLINRLFLHQTHQHYKLLNVRITSYVVRPQSARYHWFFISGHTMGWPSNTSTLLPSLGKFDASKEYPILWAWVKDVWLIVIVTPLRHLCKLGYWAPSSITDISPNLHLMMYNYCVTIMIKMTHATRHCDCSGLYQTFILSDQSQQNLSQKTRETKSK